MANIDRTIVCFDDWLRGILAVPSVVAPSESHPNLSQVEKEQIAALWRVNHAGEVCAQALYQGQADGAVEDKIRQHLRQSAEDEQPHIEATATRLRSLGGRPSLLNPLWYAGSYAIGRAVALCGDNVSLGFVRETEEQVIVHLRGHEDKIPSADLSSRDLLRTMQRDEALHRDAAVKAGGIPLPFFARALMKVSARVMTTTAKYI